MFLHWSHFSSCAKEDIVRMQLDFISHCKLSLSVHTVRIYDANAPVINVANKARQGTRMQVHASPIQFSLDEPRARLQNYETMQDNYIITSLYFCNPCVIDIFFFWELFETLRFSNFYLLIDLNNIKNSYIYFYL